MKLIKIKNKEISQLLIDKICRFKMKFWKYNLNSQLNFFYENLLLDQYLLDPQTVHHPEHLQQILV